MIREEIDLGLWIHKTTMILFWQIFVQNGKSVNNYFLLRQELKKCLSSYVRSFVSSLSRAANILLGQRAIRALREQSENRQIALRALREHLESTKEQNINISPSLVKRANKTLAFD